MKKEIIRFANEINLTNNQKEELQRNILEALQPMKRLQLMEEEWEAEIGCRYTNPNRYLKIKINYMGSEENVNLSLKEEFPNEKTYWKDYEKDNL